MKPIMLGLNGACGRLGVEVIRAALADPGVRLVAALECAGHPHLGRDVGDLAAAGTAGVVVAARPGVRPDAMIDGSLPAGTAKILAYCVARRVPLVVCTTGLPAGLQRRLRAAAKRIPILQSANMSAGGNLLAHLAAEAVRILGAGYDVEIIEAHHRLKKDAPSGTALLIAEHIRETSGGNRKFVLGRRGATAGRDPREIGISAVRGGDIVGDHMVMLAGPGERIELIHRAHSRRTFACGAVRAAKYLVGRKPGLYRMADVLDMK
ncbi:MAG: 4-hydroxy-tetrahydrodipicolinate reductase [Planctomycetota bacterium]